MIKILLTTLLLFSISVGIPVSFGYNPDRLMNAIIEIESKGNPNAVGDQGRSVGIFQLKGETVCNLWRMGYFRKWKGKRTTMSQMLSLRKDVEFSKECFKILFQHNMKILKTVANKHDLKLTESEYIELTVMAHNQGVSQTITRNLLKIKPEQQRVTAYLEKVLELMGS